MAALRRSKAPLAESAAAVKLGLKISAAVVMATVARKGEADDGQRQRWWCGQPAQILAKIAANDVVRVHKGQG